MTPEQIIGLLSVVQALGTEIGSLLSLAKGGGATDEELQAAYDAAHARAMAYVPLNAPPQVPPAIGG